VYAPRAASFSREMAKILKIGAALPQRRNLASNVLQGFCNVLSANFRCARSKPTMLIFFELLAALALGFVLGRLWEIRQELQRAPETRNRIPTARLD